MVRVIVATAFLAVLVAGCGEAHPGSCAPGSAPVGDDCVACRATPCESAMACTLTPGNGVEICDARCGDVSACRACTSDADCESAFGSGVTCGEAGGCCRTGAPSTAALFCGF